MALQSGALRDALIEAGVTPVSASKAAGEVAGYENRLTRLTTMVQAMLGIGMLLLASQGALWLEIGRLDGKIGGDIGRLDAKLGEEVGKLDAKLDQQRRDVSLLDGKLDQVLAKLAQPAANPPGAGR